MFSLIGSDVLLFLQTNQGKYIRSYNFNVVFILKNDVVVLNLKSTYPQGRNPQVDQCLCTKYPDWIPRLFSTYDQENFASFLLSEFAKKQIKITRFQVKPFTGCPNKHGTSVINSISSFWIAIWFSTVIPTEKPVIRKIFVCYVYNLFVYVFTAHAYLVKQNKKQYTNRVNLSVFTVHLAKTL